VGEENDGSDWCVTVTAKEAGYRTRVVQ